MVTCTMRRDLMINFSSCFCLFIGIFLFSFGHPVYAKNKNIFILMSYSEADSCGGPQYRGVLDAIKYEGLNRTKITRYFLNSKTIKKDELAEKIKIAKFIYEKLHPEVAIAIDDLAFQILAPYYLKTNDGYLVFTGTDISPEQYNKRFSFHKDRIPTKHITGVYEKLFIRKQLQFFSLLMKKKIGKIAILYSDDPVGNMVKNQIIDEIKDSPYEGLLFPLKVSTLAEAVEAAKRIQEDKEVTAYFPITLSLRDAISNRRLTLKDMAPLLTTIIKKPDLTVNSSFVKLGFWGGVSVDFYHMGYDAGELACLLLKGYDINELNIRDAQRAIIIINLKRNRELNINIPDVVMGMVDRFIQ